MNNSKHKIELINGEIYWNGVLMKDLPMEQFFQAMIDGLDQIQRSIQKAREDAGPSI